MKATLLSITVIVILFVVFQSFALMTDRKTKEQEYTLIMKDKDFEIRFYPAAIMATVHSKATTYKELANPGFRKLAGYIFGGNENEIHIPMTAPVHMDVNDSLSSMSFVMPSDYNESNLPKPNNPAIIIKKTSDEYVAVLRFGGFASDKRLKSYSEKLHHLLDEKGIITNGHYRFLGYNPPFRLFGRRNEIIVSVIWNGK